jgi:RNA processing factor Prp31
MIYLEIITDNLSIFKLERQKNTPDEKWYGIRFSSDDKLVTDNDEYIIGKMYSSLRDNRKQDRHDIDLGGITKEDAKTICEIIKRADELGWFKDLQNRWKPL